MTLAEYQAWLAAAPYGKRLPTALYLVRDAGTSLGAELDRFVAQLVAAYQVGPEFNVLKFRTDELKVSFLAYPDFFDAAHPVLRKSITAGLRSRSIRQTEYGDNLNPPILHRKEAFLPASHPRRAAFAELTRLEEQAGLYERPETIGFRLNWERLLADKGFVIEGHSLRRAREKSTGYSVAPAVRNATRKEPPPRDNGWALKDHPRNRRNPRCMAGVVSFDRGFRGLHGFKWPVFHVMSPFPGCCQSIPGGMDFICRESGESA